MDKEELQDKYFEWAKATDRAIYEMANIFVRDDNSVKVERRMAWVIKTSPTDYYEFCKKYDLEYEAKGVFYICELNQLSTL